MEEYGQNSPGPDFDQEISDKFAPISATTRMRTKKANLNLRGKFSDKLWNARIWGVEVMSMGVHNVHEEWHAMLQPDGTIAYFHQSELEYIFKDDDGEEDGNDGDDGDNEPPFVPKSNNPILVHSPA